MGASLVLSCLVAGGIDGPFAPQSVVVNLQKLACCPSKVAASRADEQKQFCYYSSTTNNVGGGKNVQQK